MKTGLISACVLFLGWYNYGGIQGNWLLSRARVNGVLAYDKNRPNQGFRRNNNFQSNSNMQLQLGFDGRFVWQMPANISPDNSRVEGTYQVLDNNQEMVIKRDDQEEYDTLQMSLMDTTLVIIAVKPVSAQFYFTRMNN